MKRTEKRKENERYDESNTFFWNIRQRKAKNKNKKRDHLHKKCFVYSVANRDFDSLSITVLNESGHRSWTHSRRTHTPACKQNQEETNGIFTPSPKMKISVPHFFTRAMPIVSHSKLENNITRRAVTQSIIIIIIVINFIFYHSKSFRL